MADAVVELFGYNRGSFMFDRKLRQEREYMEQDMRVQQFVLYREDVRDLADLTVSKMDTYTLISLLQLGCCLDLLVDGVMEPSERKGGPTTERWLVWLYVVSLAEAMLYLFLTTWLAMHASVSCHSFTVRLLTQFVRLPVPNQQQLDAAVARGRDFEGVGADSILRVPLLQRLGPSPAGAAFAGDVPMASAEGMIALSHAANPARVREHIASYRYLQSHWQAHDGWARACLCLGTSSLLRALSYYCVGLFVIQLEAPWASLGCTLALSQLSWLLLKLDLHFKNYLEAAFAALLAFGPVLASIAATVLVSVSSANSRSRLRLSMVPAIFLLHAVLLLWVSKITQPQSASDDTVKLPTRFSTVAYLDVFSDMSHRRGSGPDSSPSVRPASATGTFVADATLAPGGRRRLDLMSEIAVYERMLRLEFGAWEVPATSGQLNDVVGLSALIHDLRLVFDMTCAEIDALRAEGDVVGDARSASSSGASSSKDIILCLGDAGFIKASTGQPCGEPAAGALVSGVQGIHDRLEHLQMLRDQLAPPAPGGGVAASGGLALGAGAPTPRPGASASAGDAGVPAPVGGARRAESGDEPPTQETRFGGEEAARSASIFLQPYSLRRDGRSHRESRLAPGRVPWFIFTRVSRILMVIWFVGFVYYNVIIMFKEGDLPKSESRTYLAAPRLEGARRVVSAASWPAERFAPPRPVGVACHARSGSRLLVAERFRVHTVEMACGDDQVPCSTGANLSAVASEAGVAGVSAAMDMDLCLRRWPRFQEEGLAGVSVHCDEAGGPCVALLLGASGRRALRCVIASPAVLPSGSRALSQTHQEVLLQLAPPPARDDGSIDGFGTTSLGWRTLIAAGASAFWAMPVDIAAPADGADGLVGRAPMRLGLRRGVAGSLSAQVVPRGGASRDAALTAFSAEIAKPIGRRRLLRRRTSPRVPPGAARAPRASPTPASVGGRHLGAVGLLVDVDASGGLLHAWRAAESGSPHWLGAWRLPPGRRWVGACAAGGDVYASDESGEIWRFAVPGPVGEAPWPTAPPESGGEGVLVM